MQIISEKEAKAAGLNKFYTGRPCKRGHDSERWVNGSCVQCGKERDAGRKRTRETEEQKQKGREATKRWRERNKEKARESARISMRKLYADPEYRKKHLEQKRAPESREKINKRERERYNSCHNARMCRLLRSRVRASLRGKGRADSAVKMLGCTVDEAREHLEAQFSEGMSWENHGEWHIDHIKPLSWFDLSDPKQMAEACHYTNLQPLWGYENISKGNRAAGDGASFQG